MPQLRKYITDNLSAFNENSSDIQLFNDISKIKDRGYLTKEELLRIVYFKSIRRLDLIELNTEEEIIGITKLAFHLKDDIKRIRVLCSLDGVDYPMASSILTFWEPQQYGVIDFRVWRVLYKFNRVRKVNFKGINFSDLQMQDYINVIRVLSKEYNTTPRNIDLILWNAYAVDSLGVKRLYSD